MASVRWRSAGPGDVESVARLHADSWRRHYRGAYSDSYLSGDLLEDRLAVWSAQLSTQTVSGSGGLTVLADDDGGLVGFVHVVFDDDVKWGSLIGNLHVTRDRQRSGIGAGLLARAARAVVEQADGAGLYLWVLEQNIAAQRFYQAMGGARVETAAVLPPGGLPGRLNGSPAKLRFAWSDAAKLDRDRDRDRDRDDDHDHDHDHER